MQRFDSSDAAEAALLMTQGTVMFKDEQTDEFVLAQGEDEITATVIDPRYTLWTGEDGDLVYAPYKPDQSDQAPGQPDPPRRLGGTPATQIAADFQPWRGQYISARIISGDAADGEWTLSLSPVIHGLTRMPEDGEPLIGVIFNREGTKMSETPMVLQHMGGDTWMNLVCGTTWEHTDGEQVLPMSALTPRSLRSLEQNRDYWRSTLSEGGKAA